MASCDYYVDARSCFTCPYPDCRWNSNEGIPAPTPEERREHCGAMLAKYRAALLQAVRDGDRREVRRIKKRLAYWERRQKEMGGNQYGRNSLPDKP